MLARILGDGGAGIETGIGDDAAVLEAPRGHARIVWTIDEQVEGTHFRRDLASWHDIGWRSFMAAASDVAAMGAAPWCALSALVLPPSVDDAKLEQIVLGQRDAAAALGAPIVGGNLARGTTLSIATTLLASCDHAVTRAGAQPGDAVWMAGSVGMAAAGLRALQEGRALEPKLRSAIASWRTPRALIELGRGMSAVAHAAIDVSDGLAGDAGQMAAASGVRIVLDGSALGSDSDLITAAEALGLSPLDLALYGGEDYALVIASCEPVAGFRRIGEVTTGSGLGLRDSGGERAIEPRGFDHFAEPPSKR